MSRKAAATLQDAQGSVTMTYDGAQVRIAPSKDASDAADVWLIAYIAGDTYETPGAGGNRGVEMRYHNRVTDVEKLGVWTGPATQYAAPCASSCAVIVQDAGYGPVRAAARFEPPTRPIQDEPPKSG